MEEIASEFVDDDVRACGLSMGSSLVKSTSAHTRCHCGFESPVMTSRTQKILVGDLLDEKNTRCEFRILIIRGFPIS